MLRFNEDLREIVSASMVFQYILCYGSTRLGSALLAAYINFNTSYVTVQLPADACIKKILEFQYILCYGSTL